MNTNIIITAKTPNKTSAWGFTISQTGLVDFSGKLGDAETKNLAATTQNWQHLDSSTFFSPASYRWLRSELCAEISIWLSDDVTIEDADTFAFLTHIGAILVALDAGDSLLAAELFDRRKTIFEKFANPLRFIFEPVAPYALFAWVYGSFGNESEFLDAYENGGIFDSSKDTAVFLFWAAKKQLNPMPSKETAEEMFIRFFSDEKRARAKFTIGVVGTNHHRWADATEDFLETLPGDAAETDFINGTKKLAEAKNRLFENLKISVQAQPYNPADSNAIVVNAEDVPSKITGLGGMSKVGYIRATGAAILRKAMPNKFAFNAEVARLNYFGGSPLTIRVEV